MFQRVRVMLLVALAAASLTVPSMAQTVRWENNTQVSSNPSYANHSPTSIKSSPSFTYGSNGVLPWITVTAWKNVPSGKYSREYVHVKVRDSYNNSWDIGSAEVFTDARTFRFQVPFSLQSNQFVVLYVSSDQAPFNPPFSYQDTRIYNTTFQIAW